MTDSPPASAPNDLQPADVLFDPELFAAHFLYILDKNKVKRLLRYNAAQRDFMEKRTSRSLILKARQLGFSTAIQGELFRRAITRTTTAITMAHDDQTTQKLRRMQDRFWENCLISGVQPARKYSNATLISYPDFDSTCVIATAGSKEAGRGDTYSDFHGSEVAFWPDAEKILAGAMQGGDPDVVLESTPNGASGWFFERCMEALTDPKSIWKLHFYPWWWDPTYKIDDYDPADFAELDDEEKLLVQRHQLSLAQIAWRRKKKRELKRTFIQEYPEDPETCFLVSGESYFGNLANSFGAPLVANYDPACKYAAGLDWGRENDYTCLVIIDVVTKKQVDLLHINKLSWGTLRARAAAKCKRWGIKTAVAENNSIGSVNIEEFRKLGINVVPFNTQNKSKAEIMEDLYEALHEQNLQLQGYPESKHQFDSFVSTKLLSGAWRLAAAGNTHDDIVLATAIAWYARKYARVQIWVGGNNANQPAAVAVAETEAAAAE